MNDSGISPPGSQPIIPDEQPEFSGERSRSYKEALVRFPDVWREDMTIMREALHPSPGERILEVGAGSGFFSYAIADAVGPTGWLWVTDPSPEQLQPLRENTPQNVTVLPYAADAVELPDRACLDAIWSRGALHHASNKTYAFHRFSLYTKPRGRLIILDVFAGSRLAHYFDVHVAQACITGHDVQFLSRGFAESLCQLTGWEPPVFLDIHLHWHFAHREEIGVFLALLHSNKPDHPPMTSLHYAETLLGVHRVPSGYALYWPMTLMTTRRREEGAR